MDLENMKKKKPIPMGHVFERCVHAQSLSRVQLFETLWAVAFQAPLFMGFFRQECWS